MLSLVYLISFTYQKPPKNLFHPLSYSPSAQYPESLATSGFDAINMIFTDCIICSPTFYINEENVELMYS
ncbi:hypothetical protein XBO1_100004 [Xenorhabdus bovienii str. oregonense]|uniref:Uncharacterized protein n=1 Tax=Xenorhabdus bovienii str. oregonense TaxID=1398202 RepID=A0A077P2Q1_XENBV|nr:hypothetical protein XBO1_100004 [Xenorhabdus bovienii str. oregonense]